MHPIVHCKSVLKHEHGAHLSLSTCHLPGVKDKKSTDVHPNVSGSPQMSFFKSWRMAHWSPGWPLPSDRTSNSKVDLQEQASGHCKMRKHLGKKLSSDIWLASNLKWFSNQVAFPRSRWLSVLCTCPSTRATRATSRLPWSCSWRLQGNRHNNGRRLCSEALRHQLQGCYMGRRFQGVCLHPENLPEKWRVLSLETRRLLSQRCSSIHFRWSPFWPVR